VGCIDTQLSPSVLRWLIVPRCCSRRVVREFGRLYCARRTARVVVLDCTQLLMSAASSATLLVRRLLGRGHRGHSNILESPVDLLLGEVGPVRHDVSSGSRPGSERGRWRRAAVVPR
jgi:hypothetical protein